MAAAMAASKKPAAKLLALALGYPGASEEFPWGERVVKVDGRIFVFLGDADVAKHVTLKLPHSHPAALALPGAAPTGYGLGKAGWVTIPLASAIPFDVFADWLDESYRAVAKKRRIAELPAQVPVIALQHTVGAEVPVGARRIAEAVAPGAFQNEPAALVEAASAGVACDDVEIDAVRSRLDEGEALDPLDRRTAVAFARLAHDDPLELDQPIRFETQREHADGAAIHFQHAIDVRGLGQPFDHAVGDGAHHVAVAYGRLVHCNDQLRIGRQHRTHHEH
jgi:predicted DNA-binding protein (MmcQ/YjbR family)